VEGEAFGGMSAGERKNIRTSLHRAHDSGRRGLSFQFKWVQPEKKRKLRLEKGHGTPMTVRPCIPDIYAYLLSSGP